MPMNPATSFFNKNTCPSCGAALEWGVTTSKDKSGSEKCKTCKAVLGKD